MRNRAWIFFLLAWLPLTAAATPWMGNLRIYDSEVWTNGRLGNYGTAKYFLDESANEEIPLTFSVEVYADGQPPGNLTVELFSNLNRRDYAKIYEPLEEAGDTNSSYYLAYPMQYTNSNNGHYVYTCKLKAKKCGVYRVTARFRIGNGPWMWHNDFFSGGMKQRDCVVVLSPKKARDLTIYEVNPLVVEAFPGGTFWQRSTFEDFTDHDNDGFDVFSLEYVRTNLGFNTLWLMPIFPVTQWRWQPDYFNPNGSYQEKYEQMASGSWVPNISPGSPYSTRNYCSVDARHSQSNSEAAALGEFLYLVNRAEDLGLNVFIDVAFNHAGRDVVPGPVAVMLGYVPYSQQTQWIRQVKPEWCTRGSAWGETQYRQAAFSELSCAHWAPQDRKAEHIWMDANTEFFFGNYSTLGPKTNIFWDPDGWPENEWDAFYTDLGSPDSTNVHEVWNYFAHLLPYWLELTSNKLDGIRADFAQGLPPQAWEYIINVTRCHKWDFIFLAEVLDPNEVQYRANRHFDIVTTKDHHLYRMDDVPAEWIINSQVFECQLFGTNALVMHNGTSHDESGNPNQWAMVARYAVCAASYGVPMVFMGQPLGVPYKINFESAWENIKYYWDNFNNPEVNRMYRKINRAREKSEALRSFRRAFLERKNGGGYNPDIFAVACWSDPKLLWFLDDPVRDIVLAFVNLNTVYPVAELYEIPPSVPLLPSSPELTIYYNAYNLVDDSPEEPEWQEPKTADEIYTGGVGVVFSYPNEVQYIQLRIVDCVVEELGRSARTDSWILLPEDWDRDLDSLRAIRDLALKSRGGREYVKKYCRYSGELWRILSDPRSDYLRKEAVDLVALAGRAATKYMRYGDRWKSPPFSQRDWERGRKFLQAIQGQTTSRGLKALIGELLKKSVGAEEKSFGELLELFGI